MADNHNVITERPTNEQFRNMIAKSGPAEGRLVAIIDVSFSELIAIDIGIEWLNDLADERLLPEGSCYSLADLSYTLVAANIEQQMLLIEVNADADDVLDGMEEQDDE
jgi:hypothetical protein